MNEEKDGRKDAQNEGRKEEREKERRIDTKEGMKGNTNEYEEAKEV